jgi:predicted DNA-binding transcriptional regulator AlpA
MNSKKTRVRAKAVLNDTFQLVKKLDDTDATVEAMASTAVEEVIQAREEAKDKVLRVNEVAAMVGLSSSEIYRRLREGGNFPKQLNLGGDGPTSRKGWLESEIRAWLRALANER